MDNQNLLKWYNGRKVNETPEVEGQQTVNGIPTKARTETEIDKPVKCLSLFCAKTVAQPEAEVLS